VRWQAKNGDLTTAALGDYDMQQLQSALGVVALLAFAWGVRENRRAVAWKSAGVALLVTIVTALLLLKVPPIKTAFAGINRAVDAIAAATQAGTSFVFGYVGGGALPFDLKVPGAEFVLAFQALPVVLVMSVLTTLLFYWRILPPIVRGFSWLLERTMGIGGAVGLSTAANIFFGMVESPLFIRPYLARLTRGELFMVITGGMAGIAGTVFVLYATILRDAIPEVAGHILVASILGAPAALLISQLIVPVLASERTNIGKVEIGRVADSTMDAIVRGMTAGLELLLNIVAMLIVLVALVHLANAILSLLPDVAGSDITLQRMLGLLMAPVCWLMGVPWDQTITAGSLMGIKTVLNELIAYLELAKLPPGALDARSRLIMLYAMCGLPILARSAS
jgi:CNT family concentrative nucleoside transporter